MQRSCVSCGRPFDARHVELVRLLISHGANVNHIDSTAGRRSSTYFVMALECSGEAVIDMISLLLSAGADVNCEGGIGGFPVSMAPTIEPTSPTADD